MSLVPIATMPLGKPRRERHLTVASGQSLADGQWDAFVAALQDASDSEGVVRPNSLRPLIRGVVSPQRIGGFTQRALANGLVEYTGEWQASNDTEGRNSGKPARIMRLTGDLP